MSVPNKTFTASDKTVFKAANGDFLHMCIAYLEIPATVVVIFTRTYGLNVRYVTYLARGPRAVTLGPRRRNHVTATLPCLQPCSQLLI